jgi:hypothetical protein
MAASDVTHQEETHEEQPAGGLKGMPYLALGLTVGIHFFIMFALTYVGVNALDDVFVNLNRFYMAVVMVAPMVILMLIFMSHMFANRVVNIVLYAASAAVFLGAFVAIRAQAFVGDEQLIRSMIPHHSIAIKTCERADLDDAELIELCEEIVQTQREEIAQMRAILERLGG